MDDELRELERAHANAPGDLGAAERLKAALLRAGRRDEVRSRYRLGFACDQPWSAMQAGPIRGVRHCAVCRRNVHLAGTYEEFDRLAAAGHCVAALPDRLPQVVEGLVDAQGRGFTRDGGPCLVQGQLEPERPPIAGGVMPYIPPAPPPPAKGWLRRLFGG